MLIYGYYYLGKIDHLPGYFYVTTRFGHLWFIPLVPEQSYLMIDDGAPSNAPRGMPMAFQWRSALVGWMRGFLILGLVASIGSCVATLSLALNGIDRHAAEAWRYFGFSVGGVAFFGGCYWTTIRLTRISAGRAIELGKLLGLAPEKIEALFFGEKLIPNVAETSMIEDSQPSDQFMAVPAVVRPLGDNQAFRENDRNKTTL
jgi:hypothetical protein